MVQYTEWRQSGQSGRPGRETGQSPLLQDLQDDNQRDFEVTEGRSAAPSASRSWWAQRR